MTVFGIIPLRRLQFGGIAVCVLLVALASCSDESSAQCNTVRGVTACLDNRSPYSPTVSGLQPGSALEISLVGRHDKLPGSALKFHADAAGAFPGKNGGVTGVILGARSVQRVTFSGTNTNGRPVSVTVDVS